MTESSTRPETGPMQFGDDWPGIFIRGDNAIYMAMMVDQLLNAIEQKQEPNPFNIAILRGLFSNLSNCDVRNLSNSIQKMQSFKNCLVNTNQNKDKQVQKAIMWSDLLMQIKAMTSFSEILLPKDALPPAELQRLISIGIGEEGFSKWLEVKKIPEYYKNTSLARAKNFLSASQHVQWFSGELLKQKLLLDIKMCDRLSPAVALPWLRFIIETIKLG